jgi:hypothetical protein
MEDPRTPSEDIMTDSNLEPFDCRDDSSPTENVTQETTQLQAISPQHRTDSTDELSVLYTGKIIPETKITDGQSSLDHHATIEDDIAVTPEQVAPHINGGNRRPTKATDASREYDRLYTSSQARMHIGDVVYQVNNYQGIYLGDRGFGFNMANSFGTGQQLSSFQSAYETRKVYTSRKRPVVSP